MSKIKGLLRFVFKSRKRAVIAVILLVAIGFFGWRFFGPKQNQPQYQTVKAEKSTLISSITASGQITLGNVMPITTQATGIVRNVYVSPGTKVVAGQKIADLTLDQASQQKQAAALASLLQAKNQLAAAQTNIYTLQNLEFVANQKFINDAAVRGLATDDPTYIEEYASWLAAEANYKNQQGVVAQAQASVTSSALNYQQSASVITAPVSGIARDLSLSPGSPIQSNSTSTNNTNLSQSIGSVVMEGPIQAMVNLSELDIVKAKVGQKVTLTLDAFPGKTFTGKVASINTSGVVTSSVTNYPATITLDTDVNNIYPNMAVSASIITDVKDNVLTVPSSAVQTQGGQTMVKVLKNGKITQIPVETGISSDTDTEIVSGIAEGDEVVVGVVGTQGSGTSGQSPFSGQVRIGGGGGFGGGGGAALRPGGIGGGGR